MERNPKPSWNDAKLQITVYRDTHKKELEVRQQAARLGISIAEYVRIAVDRDLKSRASRRVAGCQF